MKVKITGNKQVSSNATFEKFNYRLDSSAEAVALIAETLRKSYKEPIQTSIQEYLSNARDIHRELNITKSIDVQIPTELNPEFFIRDYGSGLSKEGIQDYITFAKSTKRNSNIATGGFGFGSKSFFAYSDSFTIISYLDGIKYIYRASCVHNKEGALVLISQTKTTEPNGLQVQVAVRPSDRYKFKEGVFRLKKHWKDQDINILNLNKEEYPKESQSLLTIANAEVWQATTQSNDRYSYNQRSYNQHSCRLSSSRAFLLIDSIPYNIDNFDFGDKVAKFFNELHPGYTVAVSVKTGVLTLSKYREYIETTPENQKIIEKLLQETLPKIKEAYVEKTGTMSVSNHNDFKKTDVDKFFLFSQSYPCTINLGDKSFQGEMKKNTHDSYLTINFSIPKFIATWGVFSIYRERNYTTRGFSLMWSETQALASKQNPGEITFTVPVGNQEHHSNSRSTEGSYFNTESKFIANQRAVTFFSKNQTTSSFKVFNFEKEQPNEMELALFDFFNIKNFNTVERTIPEKKVPDKNKPKVAKVKKEVKAKPTHNYFGVQTGYDKAFSPSGKEIKFHPDELKNNPKLLFKLSELDILNKAWSKKDKDNYKVRNLACDFLSSRGFWGIQFLMVDDATYDAIIKDGQSWNAKDFDFDTYKKLPSSIIRRDQYLKELLSIQLSNNESVADLTRFSAAGVLPEADTKIMEAFKERVKNFAKDKRSIYLDGEKELQALMDGWKDETELEVKALIEKYSFLKFIDLPKVNKEYWAICEDKTKIKELLAVVIAGKALVKPEEKPLKKEPKAKAEAV